MQRGASKALGRSAVPFPAAITLVQLRGKKNISQCTVTSVNTQQMFLAGMVAANLLGTALGATLMMHLSSQSASVLFPQQQYPMAEPWARLGCDTRDTARSGKTQPAQGKNTLDKQGETWVCSDLTPPGQGRSWPVLTPSFFPGPLPYWAQDTTSYLGLSAQMRKSRGNTCSTPSPYICPGDRRGCSQNTTI